MIFLVDTNVLYYTFIFYTLCTFHCANQGFHGDNRDFRSANRGFHRGNPDFDFRKWTQLLRIRSFLLKEKSHNIKIAFILLACPENRKRNQKESILIPVYFI